MGAECGVDYVYEPDVNKAFRHLVDEALYDHGHSGYSGTIAEAGGFAVYDNVIRLKPEAEKFAWHLATDVAQKWEAALAIPFVSEQRRVEIVVPDYTHPYDQEKIHDAMVEAALKEVRAKKLLRRGEKITRRPEITSYRTNDRPYSYARPIAEIRYDVHMYVYIDRAKSALTPENLASLPRDGWYFGGCYSS